VGFLLLSVILNTHMLVRSFVREPGTRTGRHHFVSASMGIHDGREIIGRVDRHSIVTRARPSERAAFGSRGSVLFVDFFAARSFSRRTDGRTERAIAEEGFKTRIVDQFLHSGVCPRPIDSIRSDPIRPDRSRPVRSERRRTATRVGFVSSR
jgi:hypothetical protein